MLMRMKGLPLLTTAVLMMLSTGCWSRVEVNDLSFITATGIDKMEDGDIRLTLQITVPNTIGQAGGAGGSEKNSAVVVSEKGTTALDAYRRIQEKLPRKLFYSHSRVIIIGEKMARAGVSPVLDFFSRYRESRLRNYILFTKGEAAEILSLNPNWERISAEEIREEEKSQTGLAVYLKDFYDMLLSDGVEPVAAQVEPKRMEVGDGGLPSSGKEKRPGIAGAAVFHQDKLAGWMNDVEARGIQWLRNDLEDAVLTVHIPEDKGGGRLSVKIVGGETKIKPVIQNSKVRIKVEIRAEGDLYESSSLLDLSKPEEIEYVERKLAEDIRDRVGLTVDKAQKQFKSDIFGFGRAVYRMYPRAWNSQFKERWDQEFPEVEVAITPSVTVARTGLTNNSLSK